MKEFNKISVIDLLDDCPEEISDKFLEQNPCNNQSYTHVRVQENQDNVLEDWLFKEGYPLGEIVLVKICW